MGLDSAKDKEHMFAKVDQSVLQLLDSLTKSFTDKDIKNMFSHFCTALVSDLKLNYSFISVITDENQNMLKTIAYVKNGKVKENF